MVRKLIKVLKRSTFLKDVFTLMTGTTIAQMASVILAPVISRIYSPSDMAVFATYLSIVAILSSLGTFKYELAIVLPKKNEDAINITGLSISISLIISTVILILFSFWGIEFLNLITNKKEIETKWIYFVPLAVLIMGFLNSLCYWVNRKSHYKNLAVSKVAQSFGMLCSQILLGFTLFKSVGLIFGEIIGRISATCVLLVKTIKEDLILIKTIRFSKMKTQFVRYSNFPKYSLPADMLNVVTNQVPIFTLSRFFTSQILGNYFLMERVINIPISLIGKSVLDVFKQRASADFAVQGNCKTIFIKTFKTLILASILPTIILIIFAPTLFRLIFGSEWELAGEFARIMSILFFFRFTSSPLSYMFYIAEKQNYDMLWQIGLFFTTLGSFAIGVLTNNIKTGILCYALSYSVMYLIYIVLSYRFALGNQLSNK